MKNNYPIESRYSAPGPYRVCVALEIDPEHGEEYRIYHPVDGPGRRPLVLWGNGTDNGPDDYDGLLRHLAGWGFIVADNFCKAVGTGKEIIDTAGFILSQDGNPESAFFERIDRDRIGAAGHSQGSTGVIKAHTDFESGMFIKTIVPVALPALFWCDPEDRYDTSAVGVPCFIIGGRQDRIVSPLRSNRRAWCRLGNGLPAAYGITRAGHLEIQGDGGNFRGYLTAWLRFILCGDQDAAEAFRGSDPEISANRRWNTMLKNL